MESLPLDSRILVAVSGGADSVFMLHNLVEQGYENLAVVHFNHMIRETSLEDAQLVSSLAVKYKLPLYYRATDIPTEAKKQKQSLELVAREARRELFSTIMRLGNYEWLSLGHHADDQAETVLYNFLRGSGVHGLAGMLHIDQNQKIFRPLFDMTKNEIYEAANHAGLTWIEDVTNHGDDNDRAWLRNTIMPLLNERRTETSRVLYNTGERFGILSNYLKFVAESWRKEESIELLGFKYLHPALQAEVLGAWWEKCNGSREGFNHKVVQEVQKWVNSNPEGMTRVYFGCGVLRYQKGKIFFIKDES